MTPSRSSPRVDIEKEALFAAIHILETVARQASGPLPCAIYLSDYDEEADYLSLRKPHRWSFKDFRSILERVVTILAPLNMPICRLRISAQGYRDWLARNNLKDTAEHCARFSALPDDERTVVYKMEKAEGDPVRSLAPSEPVEVLELFGDPETDAFTTTAHNLVQKGFGHCVLEFNGSRDEMALLVLPMSAFKVAKKMVSLDAEIRHDARSTKSISLDGVGRDSVIFFLRKTADHRHGAR